MSAYRPAFAPVARRLPAGWVPVKPPTLPVVRRAVVLAALAPVLLLLAVKVASMVGDPVLNAYGVGVVTCTLTVMFLSFAHYRDKSFDPPVVIELPVVTLLLAVHDEVRQIEGCVRSLLDSDYPRMEIIVIDDASTDGTPDVLRRLQAEAAGRIRVIYLDRNVGKKRALVAGARLASGSVFAFTDSDCILAPDAIRRCVRALMADPDIGAVSGHVRALNARRNLLTRMQDTWYDGQFNIQKAAESFLGSVTCVSGPLAVFRRDAIENYLPAWANDRFAGAEFRFATDRQLTGYVLGQAWRGRELKRRYADDPCVASVDHPERRWRIEYVRSAHAWTIVPETLRSVIRQQVRWKKSFIRNTFFTGSFMWRRGFRIAFLYYAHIAFVLLAPVLAFRHLVWAPLNGAVLLTLLYVAGVFLKGSIWALAYRVQNPGSTEWVYRPLMSLMSATMLSWLILYSALTLRRMVWHRG